ncbi:MAG: HEAT repeat domain-containing protein [Chloroflexi bacterium]|nr:HEAT repeat domain-containing protein [Chloroflexota bacterium]
MIDGDDTIIQPKPSLDTTIAALQTQEDGVLTATVYRGLSDLSSDDVSRLKPVWKTLAPAYRRRVVQELAEASEFNFDLDYRGLGFLGLDDDDAGVREAAIGALWIDESTELMARLLELAQWDESNAVRAAAISELGRFLLLGEYGDIPEREATRAQDVIVGLLTDEHEELEVRRRALEAIANSSHEIVTEAIEEAYQSDERLMRVSAVFAMGRTNDARWGASILREMSSPDPELRYEAARAAGEVGLTEAVPLLGRLAVDNDRETQEVAVWSLGEIGGREAMRILSALAERAQDSGDDDLIEAIDDAIAEASMVGGELDFDLLDFDPDDGFDEYPDEDDDEA